jgi:hypothetical protein
MAETGSGKLPNPRIPIDLNVLKQKLRDGLESQFSRCYWWPILPSISLDTKVIESVPDTVSIAERLTTILKEPLLDSTTNNSISKGENSIEQMVRKVTYVLINQGKLDDIEASYFTTFLKLIAWQVGRIDVCYLLATDIISKSDRFEIVVFILSFI